MSDLPPPPPPVSPPPPPPPTDAWSSSTDGRAGFGSRLGALLLDFVLYGALYAVVWIAAIALGFGAFADCETRTRGNETEIVCPDGSPTPGLLIAAITVGVLGSLLIAFVYLRALGRTGQTWGRRIVGVRVVRVADGASPGFWRAFGRELFASVISSNIFYLGFLWMIWDRERQTWHDKIAGTIVIRVR